MQEQTEKKDLERQAIQLFVQIYNCNHDSKYRLLYMQERPDSVLEAGQGNRLGMEITHLFYDSDEAKKLLGRSKSKKDVTKSPEKLIDELNELISRKESKKKLYSSDYPISLLIRNMSPLYTMSDFIAASEHIYKPNHVFEDVWFLAKGGSEEWLLYNLNRLRILEYMQNTKQDIHSKILHCEKE